MNHRACRAISSSLLAPSRSCAASTIVTPAWMSSPMNPATSRSVVVGVFELRRPCHRAASSIRGHRFKRRCLPPRCTAAALRRWVPPSDPAIAAPAGARLVRPRRDRRSSGAAPTDATQRSDRGIPSGNREFGQNIRIPDRHLRRLSWPVWLVLLEGRALHRGTCSLLDAGDVAASPRDFVVVAPEWSGVHRCATKHSQPQIPSRVRHR
jgi:hypothetical protein